MSWAGEARAHAVLKQAFPDLTVISVTENRSDIPEPEGLIWHSTPRATVGLVVSGGVVIDAPPYARKWALGRRADALLNDPRADTAWIPARSNMTDVIATPDAEPTPQGWAVGEVAYPEVSDNPHNHIFTISLDGRGPMIVVRGNTAEEIAGRFNELEEASVTTQLAAVYSHLKAEMNVAQGLGPVTPQPAAQPAPAAPPQAPQAYPQPAAQPAPQQYAQPAQQYPGQPYAGQPAWQQAGAQNEFRQAGWYKLNTPYKTKPQWDAVVAQYGLRKGKPSEGGQISWQKEEKSWYCSPEILSVVGQFSPQPA